MPWTQKQMLRDANGDLIPQYWDVVEQGFKPLTGSDGANDIRLTGSILANDYLLGIEVSPGNFVDTPILNFRGTRIGIGVRFEFEGPRIDFEVRFEPAGKSISFVDSSHYNVLIDKTEDYRGTASLVLNTPRGRFRILNKSDESATLEGLTVTEFMASGNGGTNE